MTKENFINILVLEIQKEFDKNSIAKALHLNAYRAKKVLKAMFFCKKAQGKCYDKDFQRNIINEAPGIAQMLINNAVIVAKEGMPEKPQGFDDNIPKEVLEAMKK